MSLFRRFRQPDRTLLALVAQIDAAKSGAATALGLLRHELSSKEAHERIETIEQDGDEARSRLISELMQTLGPPIDHEDMFRVSRSIDDVLDNIRDFVHEVELFGSNDLPTLAPTLEPILEALGQLRGAIEMLANDPEAVTDLGFKAQKAAGQVRKRYQRRLADLYRTETVTVDMLRARELLRRLDITGLRLQEATAALSDGLMKRGLA